MPAVVDLNAITSC